MSLDVTLMGEEVETECPHCNSKIKRRECVYEANITHNLNTMAEKAGIYLHLWHPSRLGITKAKELIGPLKAGLSEMRDRPDFYKQFNAKNGWGLYDNFVPWIERYLNACEQNPDADVSTDT